MSIKDVLKPKSRKQVFEDFALAAKCSESDLKRFLKRMRRFPMGALWFIVAFMWVFALSWIVQSIVALTNKFFWVPVKDASESMFGFINIFWGITWFAIPIIIIIYGIVIIARAYEFYNSRY